MSIETTLDRSADRNLARAGHSILASLILIMVCSCSQSKPEVSAVPRAVNIPKPAELENPVQTAVEPDAKPSQQPVSNTVDSTPPNELESARNQLEAFLREHPRPTLPETSRRFWVDASGAHGIDGVIVEVTNDTVAIKKDDGKVVTVPRDKLAKLDQQFVTDTFSAYLKTLGEWALIHKPFVTVVRKAEDSANAPNMEKYLYRREAAKVAPTPPPPKATQTIDEPKEIEKSLVAVKKLIGPKSLVVHVEARESSGGDKILTATMSNLWILKHKQFRLQDAQNLQALWASVACPDDPDDAHLKLVDVNGNHLGGSRWLGGTLLEVDD